MVFSIGIAILLGIPLGVTAAVMQNSWADHTIQFDRFGGGNANVLARPNDATYFALYLGWFPLGGRMN